MLGLIIRKEFFNLVKNKGTIALVAIVTAIALLGGLGVRFFIFSSDTNETLSPQSSESSAAWEADILLSPEAMPLAGHLGMVGLKSTEAEGTPTEVFKTQAGDAHIYIASLPPNMKVYTDKSSSAISVAMRWEAVKVAIINYVMESNHADPAISQSVANVMAIHSPELASEKGTDSSGASLLVTAGVIVIMIICSMGQGVIVTGVVEEKSSRVVEVVLSTVKPRTLLLGKIVGIGAGSFTMFICMILSIVLGVSISGAPIKEILNFLPMNPVVYVGILIICALVAYLGTASITGGLAATASRQEDLAGINMFMAMLQLLPYFVTLTYIMQTGASGTTAVVLSYVPFFAPYAMFTRLIMGTAAWWEGFIALGVSIGTIFLLSMLAGLIYQRSILRMGERVKIRQIFSKS